MPTLISLAIPSLDAKKARMAVCHGTVYIDDVCVGLPDMDFERERLRGATIRVGSRKPFRINELGTAIVREPKEPKKGIGQGGLLD